MRDEASAETAAAPPLLVAATLWEVKPWIVATGSLKLAHAGEPPPVFQGALKGNAVLTAISGVGRVAAREATASLIRHYKPGAVFSVGVSGALDPSLKVGGIVLDDPSEVLPLTLQESPLWKERLRRGRISSSAKILTSPEEKAAFYKETKAMAVDMEWQGVREAALAAGIPHAAVKIVSDSAAEFLPLPAGLSQVSGPVSTPRAILEVMKDPASIARVFSFGRRISRLSKDLSIFLYGALTLLMHRGDPKRREAVNCT